MSVYAFNNVSVVGISSKGSFLGENINRYRTVESIEIEGFIDSRSSNTDAEGVKETQETISTYITNVTATETDTLQEVKINGNSLGNGKILTLDFKASEGTLNSQIIVGSYSATIEIPKDSGSFSNAIDSGGTLSPSKILEDISEDFSVSLNTKGDYEFNHSLSIGLLQSQFLAFDNEIVGEAKGFANAIFRERQNSAITSFNLILGDHFGNYNTPARETFSESYDVHSGKFSFKQKFVLHRENGVGYSVVRTHSFSTGVDGIVKIVESGQIIGNTSGPEDVAGWINTEIAGSHVRCVSIFSLYYDNFSGKKDFEVVRGISIGAATGLNSNPISVSKNIDFNTASSSYSVTYTDDEGYVNSNYYLDRTISISKNQGSVFVATENGTLRYNEAKSRDFNPTAKISSILGDESLSKARCEEFLERAHNKSTSHHLFGATHSMYLTKSSFSFNKHGKSVTYTFSYSDSVEFLPKNDHTVARSSVKERDESPSYKFSSYTIPSAGDEILHSPPGSPKSNLSTRTITVDYTLKRIPSRNIYDTVYNISSALEHARQAAINEAFKAHIDNGVLALDYDEIYITAASYTFNSDRRLSVTVTAEYPTITKIRDINKGAI